MIKNKMKIVGGFLWLKMRLQEENGTPVYSEKDIAERTSQGRRVVLNM